MGNKPKKEPSKKEPSDEMSTLGSKMMRTGRATEQEIRKAGAALVSLDVTKGPRKKK